MSNFSILFLLLATFVATSTASLEDDVVALENDLQNMDLKRQAKKSVADVSAADLLDELKKEVLDVANHKKLKSRFNDILKKKESEILAKASEKKDAEPATKDKKEDAKSSDDDFFKALETRSDDASNDPQMKRAMEMMFDDLLTKDIEALSSGDQKRSDDCVDNKGPCCDKIKHCAFLSKKGQCEKDKRMATYCPKSCNYCKVPSPPKCSKTALGCCWDKVTSKQDKEGSNCPSCTDTYRYMCKTFKDECGKVTTAGQFMLTHCKETCKFCDRGCHDDLKMGFYCSFWKKDLKWCEKKREMMLHYCPVTCGLC